MTLIFDTGPRSGLASTPAGTNPGHQEAMMKVEKGSVVSVDYELHLGDGVVVDASAPGQPMSYIHGESQIVPGLETALEGLSAGEAKQVVVAPEDGYGDHDARGLQEVPKNAFPAEMEPQVGMELMAEGPQGQTVPFVIREVKPESIVIDLNHPLAGRTLHFAVTVREVRSATPEEIHHGHVHGEHGHEHGHDEHEHEHE
jgi:FKBP-type peptidyl-prolyl cis-trans isomerase SlyD